MSTVVFDFDSTIISCESLEVILENNLRASPEKAERIREITEQGIRGALPFGESLRLRLSIASPTRSQVEEFGKKALEWVTPGVEELISELLESKAEVWIVSGGLRESLLPVAKKLQVPENRVLGVSLKWGEDGSFAGIDPDNPFSRSKWEGVKRHIDGWRRPIIAVGDAMSDYLLYEKGLVDRFILFTQYFRCEELVKKHPVEAATMEDVKALITKWI